MRIALISVFIFAVICSSFGQQFDQNRLQAGIDMYNRGQYDSAIALLLEIKPKAMEAGDSVALQSILTNLGNAYSVIGKMELSLTYYQRAMDIATKRNDVPALARITNNIGAIYSDLKDFPKALEYFEDSEKMAEKIGDEEIIADCANGKAVVYEQQLQYPEALKLYRKALEIYQKYNSEERLALAYNNIGVVYKQLNNLNQTEYYYRKALEMSQKIGAEYITTALHANLANVYLEQKQYQKAIESNHLAMNKAREIGARSISTEVYGNLMEVYAATKDYKKAYEFSRLYKEANDSLINVERSSQMAEMKARYDTEKKEAENMALKNRDEIRSLQLHEQSLKLQNRNYLLIGSMLVLILFVLVAWLFYSRQKTREKTKREAAIRGTEEMERRRISKDLHDDLGSGLAKIKLLSELTMRKTHDPDVRKNIDTLSQTATFIGANLKDMVWALNHENATLEKLVAKIRESSGEYFEDLNIQLHFDAPENIPDTPLSRETNSNILFILKECFQNIAKHSQAKNVFIDVRIDSPQVTIRIKDDGIGMDADSKAGNGLINIRERMKNIGGKAEILSRPMNGHSVILQF